MRWIELSRSWVPCPCGVGTVVTIREADENRHIRKRSQLECDICKTREFNSWNVETLKKRHQRYELERLHNQIQNTFDQKYQAYWLGHFGLCNSKRAIWEILREAGIFGKSLSAFYEELRRKPLPYYLEDLPEPNNLHLVLSLLEIEDNELFALLHRKQAIETEMNHNI